MGMSASQVRLGALYSRKNTIGYNLTTLSNQKMALSRDMQRVSKNYQDALNQKVLKWSNNSGVDYIDLSYKNLMTPSTMNQYKPYLLTDLNGKVVIDSKYEKYAAMISPRGSAGGDWASNRTAILSELTGIDAEKINAQAANNAVINNYQEELNKLVEPKKPTTSGSVEQLLEYMNSEDATKSGTSDNKNFTSFPSSFSELANGAGSATYKNWAEAYSKGGFIPLGKYETAGQELDNILTHLSNSLGKFLNDQDALNQACEAFSNSYKGYITDTSDATKKYLEDENSAIRKPKVGGHFLVNVNLMIDEIMGIYTSLTGDTESGDKTYSGETKIVWNDVNNTEKWAAYEEEYAIYQEELKEVTEGYNSAVNTKNQYLSAEEEKMIKYYDAIFSSIAEKGWTYNNDVNDTEYLNQMLQNNLYTLTTVDEAEEFNDKTCKYETVNSYSTDIASNFSNVFFVNDSDAREDALVEYEYEKGIINAKESKIDTRMQNLQTEQAAINQMIQGIESVRNENIERNFSIMS